MRTIAKKIIKYGIQKARESTFIKSIAEGQERSYKVFGQFRDSRGNLFNLYEGLRDELKPGWQTALRPPDDFESDSKKYLKQRIGAARAAVKEMLPILNTFSFDLVNKRVLEIGCWDGVTAYALAETGASEVAGSDISTYHVLRLVSGKTGAGLLTEQKKRLSHLRENAAKEMFITTPIRGEVHFLEDDICSSSLESSYFDLVCSWMLLEHLKDPKSGFKHMYRILKTGGLAFHEYNPFFALNGGHSLCTLDFHWGHARLDLNDFFRYLEQVRPKEAEAAKKFYQYNLNRMTLSEVETYSREAGFEILAFIKWPNMRHSRIMSETILKQSKGIFPLTTVLDLITPTAWLLLRKS